MPVIFATLDCDWPEDAAYTDLYDAARHWPLWFERMVCWAKKANERGRVLRHDGVPLDARAMARATEGRGAEHVAEWEAFLQFATQLRLVEWDDQAACWRIRNWSRWHRAPSDMPEERARRKAKSRSGPPSPPPTPRDNGGLSRDMSPCHGCHDTEHSRTEQSRAEQQQSIGASAQADVVDDDFSRSALTAAMVKLGVDELQAHRWAKERDESVILRALHHAQGKDNPAGHLVAELQRGGYAEAPDRSRQIRDSHEKMHRRRADERRSEMQERQVAAERANHVLSRWQSMPVADRERIRSQLDEAARRERFDRLPNWGEDHPAWQGLLLELLGGSSVVRPTDVRYAASG